MGLKDLRVPQESVVTPGGEFAVRGLSTEDIKFLVSRHGDAISAAFKGMPPDMELTSEAIAHLVMPMLDTVPSFIAEVIALAADEADEQAIAVVRRLPVPVQIEALEKVSVLTFDAYGGPKKLVEAVIRLLHGTTGLLQSLQA